MSRASAWIRGFGGALRHQPHVVVHSPHWKYIYGSINFVYKFNIPYLVFFYPTWQLGWSGRPQLMQPSSIWAATKAPRKRRRMGKRDILNILQSIQRLLAAGLDSEIVATRTLDFWVTCSTNKIVCHFYRNCSFKMGLKALCQCHSLVFLYTHFPFMGQSAYTSYTACCKW